jgi:hypothetical protein
VAEAEREIPAWAPMDVPDGNRHNGHRFSDSYRTRTPAFAGVMWLNPDQNKSITSHG